VYNIQYLPDKLNDQTVFPPKKSWNCFYDDEIPQEIRELAQLEYRGGTRKIREAILRVLTATPQLVHSYDLSQQILANTINSKYGFKADQSKVQIELSQLVKLGVLEVVNHKYIVGIKAKSYRACGAYLEFLNLVHKVNLNRM
jgi:hypothetical protein